MDVEKIAPIATSPLDGCRGRGKLKRLSCAHSSSRIRTPKMRKDNAQDADFPNVVILVIPESPHVVGLRK